SSVLALPPPPHPRCPYTTLFRSDRHAARRQDDLPQAAASGAETGAATGARDLPHVRRRQARGHRRGTAEPPPRGVLPALPRTERSEEHTSELQSRENLVCRLLLE